MLMSGSALFAAWSAGQLCCVNSANYPLFSPLKVDFSGAWASETAGGNPSHPSFYLNPQFRWSPFFAFSTSLSTRLFLPQSLSLFPPPSRFCFLSVFLTRSHFSRLLKLDKHRISLGPAIVWLLLFGCNYPLHHPTSTPPPKMRCSSIRVSCGLLFYWPPSAVLIPTDGFMAFYSSSPLTGLSSAALRPSLRTCR